MGNPENHPLTFTAIHSQFTWPRNSVCFFRYVAASKRNALVLLCSRDGSHFL